MVHRHSRDTREEVRFAAMRHPEDREDHVVHAVGAFIEDVDPENRKDMAQSQALRDALNAAEAANKAKTAYLSNLSHEIRAFMSAILMDMRMPERDGLEAAKAIRAMDQPDARGIPIIALTANAFGEDVQRSMQAGLNAPLSKPAEPNILFEALEGLVQP